MQAPRPGQNQAYLRAVHTEGDSDRACENRAPLALTLSILVVSHSWLCLF